MIRSFEEIWDVAKRIPGRFSEAEARILYDVVGGLTGAEIVEIGTLCGRSASILALVGQDHGHSLTCVDCFALNPHVGDLAVDTLLRNMRDIAQVGFTLMMMLSEKAARDYNREIDVLHVDASHEYEDVALDCSLWLPKLKLGGYAFFHDYSWNTQVKKAVKEAIEHGFEDLGTTHRLKVVRRSVDDSCNGG